MSEEKKTSTHSKTNDEAIRPRPLRWEDRRDAYNRQTHTSTGQPIAPKDRVPFYK